MKKYKILMIYLLVGFLLCCGEIGEIEEHKFEFHRVYFNGEKSYTFEIGENPTRMKRYYFNCATPYIFYEALDKNYCKYTGRKNWNYNGFQYLSVEIHLKKRSDLTPGAEALGKFGIHPWGEIK